MLPETAAEIYSHFLETVVASKAAYSLECRGDLIAVYGPGCGAFPLWPDKESADFFIRAHWPNLRPYRFTQRRLLVQLPIIGVHGIPVGIGRAPWPDAVVVPALLLYEDLVEAGAPAN